MWQLRKILKDAYKNILKNKTRSLLTSLGIIIGVSSVIIMVAVGKGAQRRIEQQISSLGTNVIIIYPGVYQAGRVRFGAGTFNRLTFEDVEKLRQEATYLQAVSPIVLSGGQVIGGGNNWFTMVQGVYPEYLQIRNWPLAYGEFFTERDVMAGRKVAVLGKTVAEELFPDSNPVGQRIRIRNVPFLVIGVLSEKGQTASGADQDDVILAPATTVLNRLRGRRWRFINMILASAISEDSIQNAVEEIRAILRESHKLYPGNEDDFTIRTQTEIIEAATETSKVLTLLLAAVAAVSLIVGGIGIMNIMLVSVTERTREIGIRMAVGARSRDILIQFLAEAVVLSLTGGLFGIIIAALAVAGINQFTQLYAYMSPEITLLAFSFAGAVGIFFGLYPARRAASLNPIEALRYE